MMDHALGMLGMAMRAGRVVSGEFSVEKAVKTGIAELVIVASDASANTTKNFRDMCAYYDCPIVIYGTKETIGHAIGKEFRASIAITDERLAQAVYDKVIAAAE